MKALVIEDIDRAVVRDVAAPQPGAGEVLLDIKAVGLCGSDFKTYKGDNPLLQLPRVPGHEISAVIAATGPDVGPEYTVGRRVIVLPYTTCGTCTSCRQGRVNACRYNKTMGVQQDGALSDQVVVPAKHLILNESLPNNMQALVEPLSVGFHAVARGSVTARDRVVVLGCGMIGLGIILGAVARGAEVIAVDVSAHKRDIALKMGAKHYINAAQTELLAEVNALTNDEGADVVIEAVGAPETFKAAIDMAAFSGRVVYVGYAKEPVTYNTQFFNLKELDIMGSRNATIDDFHTVIKQLEEMGDMAHALVSKVFKFADVEEAFPYWHQNRDSIVKILVEH